MGGCLPLGLCGRHSHPYWNSGLLAGKAHLFPPESLQTRVREGRDSKLTPGERHGRGSWVWSHIWAPVPAPAFPRCVALDKSFHIPELWFLLLSLGVNKWQWSRVGGTGK